MKDRIKTLMESQHMTQQVFADFLGINPATLSGIFNDRTKPTINIVEAIRKKFPDISLDWLMFGSGSMFQSPSSPAASPSPSPATPASPASPTQPSLAWKQEPVLDFSETPSPAAPTAPPYFPASTGDRQNSIRNSRPNIIREEVKIIDKPSRHVTEIRVYYDDQTWESFVPAKK